MVNRTDFINSLAKGLRVLEAFRAESPRLSIADVSVSTGLDRATARRCLLTLHELQKLAYEVAYERAHRPDWEAIPLGGLQALVERVGS